MVRKKKPPESQIIDFAKRRLDTPLPLFPKNKSVIAENKARRALLNRTYPTVFSRLEMLRTNLDEMVGIMMRLPPAEQGKNHSYSLKAGTYTVSMLTGLEKDLLKKAQNYNKMSEIEKQEMVDTAERIFDVAATDIETILFNYRELREIIKKNRNK